MVKPRARSIMFFVMGVVVVIFLAKTFMPQPITVDMAEIDYGPITVTVSDDGRTRVKELYVVSAPIAGRVLRLEPEVGDTVIAGQTLLAVMLPTGPAFLDERRQQEAKAALEAAKAALELAQSDVERMNAEVEYAEVDIRRAEELVKTNAASPARLDLAKRAVKTAQAQLQTAKSNVNIRRADLEIAKAALIGPDVSTANSTPAGTVKIVAPVDGVVLTLNHESEGVVVPGAPLLELGDPTKTEIIADFLSHQAVNIKIGAKVYVEAWGGEPMEGHVRLIEPKGFTKFSALGIEEQRVNVIIDFDKESEGAKRLGHGFRVEPKIILWHADAVRRVPTSAIFRHGKSWAVFKVINERVILTQVSLGHMNDDYAEIISGIEVADLVVEYPPEQLDNDSAVVRRNY